MAVFILFLVAVILFGLDFLLALGPTDWGRWRVQSLAWACIALALLLWHGLPH